MQRILSGLKVLDLTRLLPGPLCTMLMADYGAEVIKCEDTWTGDPTRYYGPVVDKTGSFFRQLNRNKKSLAINLKTPEGIKVFKKVVEKCDILIEGFRPGVMDRLGIGYDEIKEINSRIIYASISGYGKDGPYAQRAGHDINYTAITGLLDLNSPEDSYPLVSGIQVADIGGGSLLTLSAVMMAVYNRERTGEGQYIDISMTDGIMPWLTYATSYFFNGGGLPRSKEAEITGAFACYNIYPTKDERFMSLGALEPEFWQRFCKFADREDWVSKQFEAKSQADLTEEVRSFFLKKTQNEWCKDLLEEDFCCEPVLALEEASEHPQLKQRGFFIEETTSEGKKCRQVGFPIKFNSDRGSLNKAAPSLGEQTFEILKDNGFSNEDIKKLLNDGVVL